MLNKLPPMLLLAILSCYLGDRTVFGQKTLSDAAKEQLKERDRLAAEAYQRWTAGQTVQAIAVLKKVLAIEREVFGNVHDEVAGSLDLLGGWHGASGDFAAAQMAYQEEMAIQTKLYGAKHWKVTDTRWELAYVEVLIKANPEEQQDLAKAIDLGWRSTRLKEQGKFREALPFLQQCLEIRRRILGARHAEYAKSLNNLAYLYLELGDYSEAKRLFQETLAVNKEALGEDHPKYAISLGRLATVYQRLGDYEKAAPLMEKALQVHEQTVGPKDPLYAGSLNNLALLYNLMGFYQKAEPLLRRSVDLAKETGGQSHPDYVISLNNLAMFYEDVGDYARAEAILEEVLKVARQSGRDRHPDYATYLTNLGLLHYQLGDYRGALPRFVQACDLWKNLLGERHAQYGLGLQNLAQLYLSMGAYTMAEPLLQKAQEISEQGAATKTPQYASLLGSLASIHLYRGELPKAKALCEQALEVTRQALGENHHQYAVSLNNLAAVYTAQGEFAKAESLCRKALETQQQAFGEKHPGLSGHLAGLAFLYQATDRPNEALATQVRLLEVNQSNLQQVFEFSAEPVMHAYLAKVRHDLDGLVNLLAARQPLEPSGVKIALTWTLRRKAVILDSLCRFREGQMLLSENKQVAERVAQLRGLRQRLANLALKPPPGMDAGKLRREMADLRDRADWLQAQVNRAVSQQHPEPLADSAEVDGARVQARLAPGTALIEVLRVPIVDFRATRRERRLKPAHYFVFVLPAGKDAPKQIDLGPAEAIDQAVGKLREHVERAPRELRLTDEKSLEADFRTAACELYRLVFAPLRSALGQAKLVYLAADGELNRLPFEALVDSDGKYLLESMRFAYLSSGRDLLRAAGKPAKGTVVFAGPSYDLKAADRQAKAKQLVAVATKPSPLEVRGAPMPDLRGLRWKALPGAAAEAEDVRRALNDSTYGPVQTYSGAEALEEVFKAMPPPRLLHIATHGFFLPDPKEDPKNREEPALLGPGLAEMGGLARLRKIDNPLLRSGLVLAGANTLLDEALPPGVDDGWVTAEEIALMNLRGTELVVLSACETGLGDIKTGEGVYGLRRAFMYAGARTLVTSLFKVPDEQTRQMMRSLYGGLKAGKGKLESLHEAQLEMIRQRRQEHGAAHPFFWASFVLVGDPD